MSVPDGAILRIVLSILMPDNVIAQNVFYAVFTDTGVSDAVQDVIDDLATWLTTTYAQLDSHIPAVSAMGGIKVYIYDAIDEDWDELGDGVPIEFWGAATDMLPHGAAAVIHAKTTDPDVQGTKYVPGLAEGSQASSVWTGAALTALVSFANNWTQSFDGDITEALIGPGVWSPTRENFFLFNQVEVVNTLVGYQRRRKPGVGI